MAAVMNFVGALLGTRSRHRRQGHHRRPPPTTRWSIVLAALIGAIIWNLITWCYGLPSSSTHALIGGLVGAASPAAQRLLGAILDKVVLPMVISPLVGFCLAFALMVGIMWLFRNAGPDDAPRFRVAQTASAAAMALGHGLQDAQKTMGVILLALVAVGFYVPTRAGLPLVAVISSALAISRARTWAGGASCARSAARSSSSTRPAAEWPSRSRRSRALRQRVRAARPGLDHAHDHLGDHGRRRHPAGSPPCAGASRGNIAIAWVLTIPMAGLAAALCYWIVNFAIGGF